MKIKFLRKKDILFLGYGNKFVEVDEKNNVYIDLVKLINSFKNLKKIEISTKKKYKQFALIMKSIYYSDFNKLVIQVNFTQQIYKYIVSKIFKKEIILVDKILKNKSESYIYKLNKKNIKFKYDYSLVLITEKFNIDRMKFFLNKFKKINLEIIFVINENIKLQNLPSNVKILYYKESKKDLRFNISKKKNFGFIKSIGRIVIIVHDRIKINLKWFLKLNKFASNFDIYTSRIISKDMRFLDKIAYKFDEYLFQKPRLFYLKYSEMNNYQYIDGGIFVLNNRRYYKQLIFDQNLNWTEMEDVDFSAKTKLECNFITFDKYNSIESEFKNHFKLSKYNPIKYLYKTFVRKFFDPF